MIDFKFLAVKNTKNWHDTRRLVNSIKNENYCIMDISEDQKLVLLGFDAPKQFKNLKRELGDLEKRFALLNEVVAFGTQRYSQKTLKKQ